MSVTEHLIKFGTCLRYVRGSKHMQFQGGVLHWKKIVNPNKLDGSKCVSKEAFERGILTSFRRNIITLK